jgi:hypothetical protein
VPIRIDASSEAPSRFRIIDTLLIDTTCLPAPVTSTQDDTSPTIASEFSLSSLIERNASYLTESILADAEVYGAVRSSKHYLGGRLDLLSDTKLYETIHKQISTQLSLALNLGKSELLGGKRAGTTNLVAGEPYKTESSDVVPDTHSMQSNSENNGDEGIIPRPNIVRIKLRLRHENIVVVDEFDYDVNLSGLEGSDPFSIAKGMSKDLNLPKEFEVSIASSILEQIYGIDVPESFDGVVLRASRDVPTASALNVANEGSSTGFAQMILET